MKKTVSVILVIAMLMGATLILSSCGKEVECDECGEMVKEKHIHALDIFGETINLCEECYQDWVEFFN